jgi:hypothetical protein
MVRVSFFTRKVKGKTSNHTKATIPTGKSSSALYIYNIAKLSILGLQHHSEHLF